MKLRLSRLSGSHFNGFCVVREKQLLSSTAYGTLQSGQMKVMERAIKHVPTWRELISNTVYLAKFAQRKEPVPYKELAFKYF
jgi:hypothetical protein